MALIDNSTLTLLAVVVMTTLSVTYGGTIRLDDLDDKDSVKLKPEIDSFDRFYRQFLEIIRPPTVLHFAKHSLCKGQIDRFETAMARVLKMDESFVRKFVRNLCDKKPPAMLKLWAAELFDSDGDGYINDHEKHATFDRNYDD